MPSETSQSKHCPTFYREIPIKSLWGMTTQNERKFLLNYAQNDFTAEGEIVDLGCWFGSLTVPLLVGLRNNPNAQKASVYAYDMFKWQEWMRCTVNEAQFMPNPYLQNTLLGQFMRQVLPHDKEGRLQICSGDVTKIGWSGKPIELLVVDVMKSWELANSVLRDFYPSLIPGKSLVFHQDFFFYGTAWIHLIQYALRDYFEPEEDVVDSYAMVFRNTKKIPAELLNRTYGFDTFTQDEYDAAFEYAESMALNKGVQNISEIRAAHITGLLQQGQVDRAGQLLEKAWSDKRITQLTYENVSAVIDRKHKEAALV